MKKIKITPLNENDILFYVSNYFPEAIGKVRCKSTVYINNDGDINISKKNIFNDFRYEEYFNVEEFFSIEDYDSDDDDDVHDILYDRLILEEVEVFVPIRDNEFLNEIISYNFIDTSKVMFTTTTFLVFKGDYISIRNHYPSDAIEETPATAIALLDLYQDDLGEESDLAYFILGDISDITLGLDYTNISIEADLDIEDEVFLIIDYNSSEGTISNSIPELAVEIPRYKVFTFFGNEENFKSLSFSKTNEMIY